MTRRIVYVMPLPPGAHPGMDTVAHGIVAGLAGTAAELRVMHADLRDPNYAVAQIEAVYAATQAKVDGICLFVLDEHEPAAAVWRAIGSNVPVVCLHKPAYPTTASIVVPNFYHGIYLSQYLARHVDDSPRVAIIGGPPILDDDELVEGLLEGGRRAGFKFLNDPHSAECRNSADVAGAGVVAVTHVLDTYPQLQALIVFNDETLLDVLPLLEARGLLGKLPVISRNGSPAAVESVRRGDSLATYDYCLPELGIAAGKVFKEIFEGADPQDAVVCPSFGRLIHRDNIDEYVPWERRAPAVPLVSGLD